MSFVVPMRWNLTAKVSRVKGLPMLPMGNGKGWRD